MKVLLINPPNKNQIACTLPAFIEEEKGVTPPLGVLLIAAYLRSLGEHEVNVIDAQVENMDYKMLEARIRKINPDVIGITGISMALKDVAYTVRLSKAIKPEVKVVVGGPHAQCYPEETARLKGVDYVVYGEGEIAFSLLLGAIDNVDLLKKIKGLAFLTPDEKFIDTGHPEPVKDLDSLPFPARDLTPFMEYYSLIMRRRPVTNIITSRGCPFKCNYCNRPAFERKFRPRSAKNVVAEIKECTDMGIRDFIFYDDTFTIDRRRVIDICEGIILLNRNVSFDIRTRVDIVDEEMLGYLKKAGCSAIHYGVESGSEKVLRNLNKGISLEMISNAFRITRRLRIGTLAYFMIGSPGETREDIEKTFRLVGEIKPDYSFFSVFTPYPGTKIYESGVHQGLFNDWWLDFAKNPDMDFELPVWNEFFSRAELSKLMLRGYRKFCLNPRFIMKQLLSIRNVGALRNNVRAALKMLSRCDG